ncbi:DNA-3-methyladenine glycosylase I [Arboricoccus pini]|uniref:DNA-3-methyladenine glycosylase I n=2 Tax=Arboricoccus pini TaxID=1963835 RepID=A0A212QSD7_9PROT|nr:DNA-3-methyladenine glycosylase I [Arboricoccus pini]
MPLVGDRSLFEFLTLEGAQAGLSWRTVLERRAAYREAFLDYEIEALAALSDDQLMERLANPGLVRNRLKIQSVRTNARAALPFIAQPGGLTAFLWAFAPAERNPVRAGPGTVPSETPESRLMSRDLRKAGFTFVGPTICYALMQATGMVNDHLKTCHRQSVCAAAPVLVPDVGSPHL